MTKHVLVKFHNYRDIQKDSACFRRTKMKYMTIFNQKKKKKPKPLSDCFRLLTNEARLAEESEMELTSWTRCQRHRQQKKNILMDFAEA